MLSREEGLTTDLRLVLKRVQTRDDPGGLLIWWRGLRIVNLRPMLVGERGHTKK